MLSLFTFEILDCLKKLDINKLYEMRLRVNCPIRILYDNKWGYLSKSGVSVSPSNSVVVGQNSLLDLVVKATEYSLYSATNSLSRGFIALSNGCRIGVCGEIVNIDGKIKTLKNFTSLIIRFPHSISSSCLPLIDFICNKTQVYNSLIISPPGGGKTTILRSLAALLSNDNNVLIVDERQEIAGANEGKFTFDIGECDVVTGGDKSDLLSNFIRSCAPQVIITDEISQEDYNSIRFAVSCGVSIITSIHALSIDNLLKKPNFEKFFSDKIFYRYIVLEGRNNPGKVIGIYDENLARIL